MALSRRSRSGQAIHASLNAALDAHHAEAGERLATVIERLADLEGEQKSLLTLKRKLEAAKAA